MLSRSCLLCELCSNRKSNYRRIQSCSFRYFLLLFLHSHPSSLPWLTYLSFPSTALGTAQGVASSIRSNAPFSTTTPPAPTSTSMTANMTSMTNGNGTGTASGSIASNTSKPTGAAGKLLAGGSAAGLVAVLGVVGLLL